MGRPALDAPRDRTLLALAAIAVGALALRLVDLGGRIAHWDEGRVAHDALRYHKAGIWEYHPVVHGPFIPKVNNHVFGLLGADDASARLVVAIIGGLAPLVAWLFRDHLDRDELIGLGLLLAANPILLYYSRFMRNDVALAVVMLLAFGLFVRAVDTGRPVYLYPAVVAVALGFTMKGNAALYPVSWLGALAVVLDHSAVLRGGFRADGDRPAPGAVLVAEARRAARGLLDRRVHVLGSTLLGLAVIVAFYVPKGPDAIGLLDVLLAPWRVGELLEVGLIEPTRMTVDHWVTGSNVETPYLSFLGHYLETLAAGGIVVSIFAVVGFIADRYHPDGPRRLVMVAALWGFVSVLGYPIAADIRAPWLAAHAVVPLAIPAAVGLARLYRAGVDLHAGGDRLGVGAAALVGLLVVAAVVQPAVTLVYLEPTAPDNQLVQFAQPGGDWGDTVEVAQSLAVENDGVDVLYVGSPFFMLNESSADHKPAGGGWYDRLPLPWYEEQVDAEVASEVGPGGVADVMGEEAPPVVIVTPEDEDLLEGHVEGYDRREHLLRVDTFRVVIYLDTDRPPA